MFLNRIETKRFHFNFNLYINLDEYRYQWKWNGNMEYVCAGQAMCC